MIKGTVMHIERLLLNDRLLRIYWHILSEEKKYDIETLSIDRVLIKEKFCGEIMQKMCTKS